MEGDSSEGKRDEHDVEHAPLRAAVKVKVFSVSGEFAVITPEQGPLPAQGDEVSVETTDGRAVKGRVEELRGTKAILLFFSGRQPLGITGPRSPPPAVCFTGRPLSFGVSAAMLGRTLDGIGTPIDDGPEFVLDEAYEINGRAYNPCRIALPKVAIQTGISGIDVMASVTLGQSITIFSAAGLPHNEVVAQICRSAVPIPLVSVTSSPTCDENEFVMVFVGLGMAQEAARFFTKEFRNVAHRMTTFFNMASDDFTHRLLTPHLALTLAEHLAFDRGKHVLVIITDLSYYVDAYRSVYFPRDLRFSRFSQMYQACRSALADIYARAGCISGRSGSITLLNVVTMPNDDSTHAMPDAAASFTGCAVYLDRFLHTIGVYPPIDVGSFSRCMRQIDSVTRIDHPFVVAQLVRVAMASASFLSSRAVLGEEMLEAEDFLYLEFLDRFRTQFLAQGRYENRNIARSLDIAWSLLRLLPSHCLNRVPPSFCREFYQRTEK